jgi:PKD repeat protein
VQFPQHPRAIDSVQETAASTRRKWRSLLSAVLAAVGIALALPAGLAQTGAEAPRAKPPFPSFDLPDRSQGERAISRLANRLPEVAAWYGMTVPEFTRLLREDRTAWLDRKGRVFFQEDIQFALQTITSPLTTNPLSPSLEPPDQTFKLHSRVGAKRTIYLNFVGATLTGTAWNSSGNTITALPFDFDGLPYSFSSAELDRIQYIWKRVAEDYSPFDVDVTTEPPPADRLTRSSSSDDTFGTTVLITSRSGVYSCSCGGVAYLTVFDDVGDFYKPALVFYDALGGGNEKYVADAISHEAGHNMGLGHDGTSSSGYYSGHGSGETGWAPIMGVGYYQPLVQWSKGEYAGANNTQDDYAVMQNTGLPPRTDDHGNSTATATAMPSTTANGVTTFTASGVIERPTDVDFFSFAAGAGSVTINVSPAPRGPKLDVLATLRNGAGAVIATSNPTDSLPASIAANISTAGTYYVSVDGVGKGDPLSTGYTDYGSVGQYTVSVTTQATTSQPPTAVMSATPTSGTAPLDVTFDAAGSTDSDGTIVSYAWTFGDGGSQTGGPTAQRRYSTAGTYTASLTVTDNSGLTDIRSVAITVQAQTTNYALTVSKAGAGAGTVSSSPAGIACGTACSASYAANTTVTLTAAPAAGSTFAGWSGPCSGTGSCTVAMTTARNVSATFNPVSYRLTVSKGGMGTGAVASSPSGIDCGADCTEDYSSGASVTLSATPAAGTAFTGWSGACSGSGACTVSMTSARSVTASFDVIRTMSVANIAMSLRSNRGRSDALASVTVRDGSGNPVPGAQVSGTWSGVVSGNASVTTNSSGVADFRSASVKATTGSTFIFTVTGVTLAGYAYDAARNVETSDSITR